MNEDQLKEHINRRLEGTGYTLVANGKSLKFRREIGLELCGKSAQDVPAAEEVCAAIDLERRALDSLLTELEEAPDTVQHELAERDREIAGLKDALKATGEQLTAVGVEMATLTAERDHIFGELELAKQAGLEAQETIKGLQADLEAATAPREDESK